MDRTLTFARQNLMASPGVDLSVVMPCYNESETIENVLREWTASLTEAVDTFEIIVINDGSTDGTGRCLDRMRKDMKTLRVIHQLKSGHGKSVRRGYALARGSYILQVDSNGCYEVQDFFRLWNQREAPMVLATRTRRIDGLFRQAGAYLLKVLTNFVFGTHLTDPNVPFRLYQRDAMMRHISSLDGAAESLNLLLAAKIARETSEAVKEVPVPFRIKHPREPIRFFSELAACVTLFRDVVQFRYT